MNGLIQQQMAPPAGGPQDMPQAEAMEPEDQADQGADEATEPSDDAGGALTITPESIQSKLHLQPPQVPQLQRIVVAGMKVMFDPKTHKMMLEELHKPGELSMRLGQSIAGLMGILLKESNNSLPPQLIIPAGVVLLAHAADFVAKTGTDISDKDVGDAMQVFVHVVLHMNGMDSQKMAALGEQQLQKQGGAPESEAPAEEQAEGPSGEAVEEAQETPQMEAAEPPQEQQQEQQDGTEQPMKGMIGRSMRGR